MANQRLTAIEIFAGGGGLAVGLRDAGFTTAVAVEVVPSAVATFKANHPDVSVLQEDVRAVDGARLLSIVGGPLDLLAACPPCQGFSTLTAKWQKTDPRNDLVREVARLAEEMQPRAVMVENVPGLVDKGKLLFEELVSRLENAGYRCRWAVLQVADFGVPQRRRRLVLLAGRGFEIDLPKATHSRTGKGGLPLWRTVRDALAGVKLPAVTFREAKALGGPAAVDWHLTRDVSAANLLRLQHAKPGAVWKDLPEEIRPPCHQGGYDGFTNAYGRLRWDEPSATITAGCISPSKGRFGHPEEDRTISLREAALLQTFPPNYRFETPYIDHACAIIGNALPCVFARIVAASAANSLRTATAASVHTT